jgi:hypothetical protein
VNDVGEKDRLAQLVGHENDRAASVDEQCLQNPPEFLARERIECSEGFVQQQDCRLMDQRPAKLRALLHSAGELPRHAIAQSVQSDGGQQFLCAGDVDGLVLAEPSAVRRNDLERQQNVIPDSAPWQQGRVLERDADRLQRCVDLPAIDANGAAARRHQTAEQPQKGGFAAPARADDRDKAALLDRELDAGERQGAFIPSVLRIAEVDEVDTTDLDKAHRPRLRVRLSYLIIRSSAGGK